MAIRDTAVLRPKYSSPFHGLAPPRGSQISTDTGRVYRKGVRERHRRAIGERNPVDRYSAGEPVFHGKALDALELARISRNQRQIESTGVRGNEHVVGPNRLTALFQA